MASEQGKRAGSRAGVTLSHISPKLLIKTVSLISGYEEIQTQKSTYTNMLRGSYTHTKISDTDCDTLHMHGAFLWHTKPQRKLSLRVFRWFRENESETLRKSSEEEISHGHATSSCTRKVAWKKSPGSRYSNDRHRVLSHNAPCQH